MKKTFTTQAETAQKELNKAKHCFKPKRKSVLIRIQKKWHTRVKECAKKKRKTISKLHDQIYPIYFKHKADDG